MIIFLELETLLNIFKVIEADEECYFNNCDFFVGLQLRNMALFFFSCTLPNYCWTSVVTSWQTLAGTGLQ